MLNVVDKQEARREPRLPRRTPSSIDRRRFRSRSPLGRRHTARAVAVVVVTLLTDLAFSYGATLSMRALSKAGAPLMSFVTAIAHVTRGTSDEPLYFATTLALGLLVAGAYRVRRDAHPSADIIAGCMLGVAVVHWAPSRTLGLGVAVPAFLVTSTLVSSWVLAGRWLLHRVGRRLWPSVAGIANAIVIGDEESYRAVAAGETDLGAADLVGFVPLRGTTQPDALGTLHELDAILVRTKAETVIVATPLDEELLRDVLDVTLGAGCRLLYSARTIQIAGVRPNLVWRRDEPYFELGAPVLRGQEQFLKRLVDVVVSATALLLLAPLLVIIALLVWRDSPGPILFAQHRAGLFGRRFRMWKFRTMHADAEGAKDALAHLNHTGDRRLFKIPNDPRVTRFGMWLRHWSLDELPQLWNVLMGDMSIVGPRPFFESDLMDYEAHHFRRLDVKPGITGLWQVSGRSDLLDFDEVVRLDREYIERWSLWLDFTIMARTLPAVLRRRGAY